MHDQSGEGLSLADDVFGIRADDDESFEKLRVRVANYQRAHIPLYDRFCDSVGMDPAYLPVESFGLARVAGFREGEEEAIFESSGTTGSLRSRHHVKSVTLYAHSVTDGFRRQFGEGPFTIRALLPKYREQGERSSLVAMAQILIEAFGDDQSGFEADEGGGLLRGRLRRSENPLVVFGAAFGLADVAERRGGDLIEADVVIETGGMKTHRREMSRVALHETITTGFNIASSQVWSEYGMCEMMSQCYMQGNTAFTCPPWVRFDVLDPSDPGRSLGDGEEGRLAIIDLANVHTVSALLTGDRAVRFGRRFAVLGRISGEELRGCNFLLDAATASAS